MRKIVTLGALTTLLVIFPLVSYIYLKKGIAYRKQVLSEINDKKSLGIQLMTPDSGVISFKNACSVIDIKSSKETRDAIYNQFKEAKGFQFLTLLDKESFKPLVASYKAGDAILNNSIKNLDTTSYNNLLKVYPNNSFIIVDSLGNVRRTYQDTKEDNIKLVNHIAALLPYYLEKKSR